MVALTHQPYLPFDNPPVEAAELTQLQPNLAHFDFILINTSGGKDSQTAMRYVLQQADAAGVPRCRLHATHADLDRMEWPGTKELVREQCAHYKIPLSIVIRRRASGETETLLDYVRRRKKWPSSTTRYCTSDFKRAPCQRVLTDLAVRHRKMHRGRSQPARILNIFGFRAEESPARAKRQPFCRNDRASNSRREVWDWLPIHEWTEEQVWADIKASGVRWHPAYDLGMSRLSCSICIFAPHSALMIAGAARPDLLQEYVDLEREIGHDFQNKRPIRLVQEALARGEAPGPVTGVWNM